jgi:uncharacterized OsmC-like protein
VTGDRCAEVAFTRQEYAIETVPLHQRRRTARRSRGRFHVRSSQVAADEFSVVISRAPFMTGTRGVQLRQDADYRFALRFAPELPEIFSDEAPPLGQGAGPSPVQLLAAAVGNCLAASLLFALRKFKQAPEPIGASAEAVVGRNGENRLRVQRIEVRLTLGASAASLQHLDKVLGQFEEFCTVTQSVRAAFPVEVQVYDSEGQRLK